MAAFAFGYDRPPSYHIFSTELSTADCGYITRQQFAKYGLMRLGVGVQLTRIVRGNYPRRLAPADEVLAIKPELTRTQ